MDEGFVGEMRTTLVELLQLVEALQEQSFEGMLLWWSFYNRWKPCRSNPSKVYNSDRAPAIGV